MSDSLETAGGVATPPTILDGYWLRHCWHGAATALLDARARLDDANVFPVADGDTGTNMAATLAEAVADCGPEPHAGRLLASLATAALAESRGNSGIILAQFLDGFAAPLTDDAAMDTRALAAAARRGAQSARSAVAAPVEGTVLTVMDTWAAALASTAPDTPVPTALAAALGIAEAALAATPAKLKVLADAGVVDAGADGFVCLLRGFSAALAMPPRANPRLAAADALAAPPDAGHHPAHAPTQPNFRWCTEIVLEDATASSEQLRTALADLGDSLITAGRPPRLKVHLHTNEPHRAAARLRAHGRLGRQKVEDMRLQYAAHHSPAAPVGLVTDSGCDLPEPLRERFQIHEVPLTIQWGPHQYIDGRTLTAADFYRLQGELPEHPTTSQPPPGRFERLYADLLGSHESVLSLHLSGRLSGTLGAARLAAERTGQGRVHCVDSHQLSAGLGLIVLGTAEALAAGADALAATAAARRLAERTRIFVAVPHVALLVRSGRVRPGIARLARWSGLKPLVSVGGSGKSGLSGAAFSAAGLERQLLARLRREARRRPALRWAVVHAGAAQAAARLADNATVALGRAPAYVMETSPLLGIHAGIGSVALAVTWQ